MRQKEEEMSANENSVLIEPTLASSLISAVQTSIAEPFSDDSTISSSSVSRLSSKIPQYLSSNAIILCIYIWKQVEPVFNETEITKGS